MNEGEAWGEVWLGRFLDLKRICDYSVCHKTWQAAEKVGD